MAVALSSLRVTADLDTSGYVRGAQAMASASGQAINANAALGSSLAQADASLAKVPAGMVRLSAALLEGYSAGAKFESILNRIGNSADQSENLTRTKMLLEALSREYGLLADAQSLYARGFVRLASVVDEVNGGFHEQAEAAERAAQGQLQLAAAAEKNAKAGYRSGPGSAQASAEAMVAAERAAAELNSLNASLIEGASAGQKFDAVMRRIGETLSQNGDLDHATLLVEALSRQYGILGDSTALAKQGYANLAPAIENTNAKLQAETAATEKATAAQKELAATTAANAKIGFREGPGSAQASALIYQEAAKNAAEVDSLSRAYVEGYSAAKNFETEVLRVGEALDKGSIDGEKAEVILEGVSKKFNMLADSEAIAKQGFAAMVPVIDNVAAKLAQETEAAERAAAAVRAASASTAINTATGLRAGPGSAQGSADAFQAAQRETAEIEKLRLQYDMLYAAEKRHAAAVADIQKVYDAGGFGQGQAAIESMNNSLRQANITYVATKTALGGAGQAARLTAGEFTNLTYQINDVVTGLALGQPVMMIFTQQAGQIFQILAQAAEREKGYGNAIAGAFNQITARVGQFAGSIGGIVTGILAIAGATLYAANSWSNMQIEIQKSLAGLGRGSGATVDDIMRIGEALSSVKGLSASQGRDIASSLAGTGKIALENIQSIGAATKDFAATLNVDLKDGTKILATMFAEPTKGAELFAEKVGGISAANLQNIRVMESMNERTKAQAYFVELVKQNVVDHTKLMGPLDKAWEAVTQTVSKYWDKARGGASTLFPSLKTTEEQMKSLEAEFDVVQGRLSKTSVGSFFDADLERLKQIREEYSGLKFDLAKPKLDADYQEQSRRSVTTTNIASGVEPDLAKLELLKGQIKQINDLLAQTKYPDLVNPQQVETLERATESIQRQVAAIERLRAAYPGLTADQAQQLASMQLQLTVAEAITPAAKARAEAEKTILELLNEGKSAVFAQAVGNAQLATSTAQVNSAARAQLLSLKDQLAVAQALTAADRQRAEAQAATNALLREGVDPILAQKVGMEQLAIAQEQANRSVEDQTRSLQQQTQMLVARANGTEAEVASAQAYANAIRQGADATQAAALAAATMDNYLTRAAIEADKLESSMQNTAKAAGTVMINGQAQSATGSSMGMSTVQTSHGTITGSVSGGSTDLNFFDPSGTLTKYFNGRPLTFGAMNGLTPSSFIGLQPAATQVQYYQNQYSGYTSQQLGQMSANSPGVYLNQGTTVGQGFQGALQSKYQVEDPKLASEIAKAIIAGTEPLTVLSQVINKNIGAYASPNARFQAELDLEKRAGVAPTQILADIKSGKIGAGADPTLILQAMDSLTEAIKSNTAATLSLSPFYTQQGDHLLGYRGYSANQPTYTTIVGDIPITTAPAPAPAPAPTPAANQPVVTPTLDSRSRYLAPPGWTVEEPWAHTTTGSTTPPTGSRYIYSSDPNQDQRTRYAFANGGVMTAAGPSSLMPIRSYADGGVAYSPEVSIFGEGSGPEAYIPLKNGAIPVRLSNKDRGPHQQININAPLIWFAAPPSVDEVRETAYQAISRLQKIFGGR